MVPQRNISATVFDAIEMHLDCQITFKQEKEKQDKFETAKTAVSCLPSLFYILVLYEIPFSI